MSKPKQHPKSTYDPAWASRLPVEPDWTVTTPCPACGSLFPAARSPSCCLACGWAAPEQGD